jgi:hypothetical protein
MCTYNKSIGRIYRVKMLIRKQELVKDVVLIGLIVIVACSTVQAAGLGVSPPRFTLTDALRGGEYESTFTVLNFDEDDVDCVLSATGPVSEWLTFYRVEDPLTPLSTYLFNWDKAPGEDSERLLQSLKDVLDIGWAEDAAIQKSDDNKTISIFTDEHRAEITLDEQNGTATLKASGGITNDLQVKKENDQLNVFVSTVHIEGVYIFTWSNVPGNESEKLLKYLWEDLALGWARNAEIQKSVNNRTIRVFSGVNWAEITLDEHNENATLTISDGGTYDLSVNEEDGMLKICKLQSKQRILVKITIAEDAPNMIYNSTIYIKNIPPETAVGAGAGAHSVVRMKVDASIAVTGTQILKGAVKSISTANTEIGYPLRIMVEFQNGGNVIATPAITCCITKNSTIIDTFVHDETGIKPDKLGTITVPWNTTGHEPEDYNVSVNVSLGGEMLASDVLPFSILPYCTFTRTGELKSVFIEGKPVVNCIIKVIAEFENTGTIDIRAKFIGEVYCDGALIDIVESDERSVAVAETVDLISYYKIPGPGDYMITGSVVYDGKETKNMNVSSNVPEPLDGELLSLSIKGTPQIDRNILLVACFANIGTVDTNAWFEGEIYCDDDFIDIVESEEKLVAAGETVDLKIKYLLTMPGEYLITGTVLYDGRETETIDYSFTVPEPQ